VNKLILNKYEFSGNIRGGIKQLFKKTVAETPCIM
jgi:hypothetical protein